MADGGMQIGQVYKPFMRFVGAIVPNVLMKERSLSPTAKLCFGRLAQYSGEKGNCFPSLKTLAGELAKSERQTLRALGDLEKFGLIRRHSGSNLSHKTTRYEFVWHQILEDGQRKQSSQARADRSVVLEETDPSGQERQIRHSEENHLKENQKTPIVPLGDERPEEKAKAKPDNQEAIPWQEIAQVWNEKAPSALPRVNLPFTKSRQRTIRPRWLEKPELSYWARLFGGFALDPFYLGRGQRKWKADIDYAFRKHQKLMEKFECMDAPSRPTTKIVTDPDCPDCQGDGMMDFEQGGIWYSKPCHCRKEVSI